MDKLTKLTALQLLLNEIKDSHLPFSMARSTEGVALPVEPFSSWMGAPICLAQYINDDEKYFPDLCLSFQGIACDQRWRFGSQFERGWDAQQHADIFAKYFGMTSDEVCYIFLSWQDAASVDERISRVELVTQNNLLGVPFEIPFEDRY